jgi:hypothetical protein
MKELSRREFVLKTVMVFGSLGRFVFFSLITIVIGYLLVKFVVSLFAGSSTTWILVFGILTFYIFALILKVISRFVTEWYVKKTGNNGKANLAALDIVGMSLFIGFAGSRAMVAYQINRIDNLIMWCCLVMYFTKQIFVEIKKIKLNEIKLANKANSRAQQSPNRWDPTER